MQPMTARCNKYLTNKAMLFADDRTLQQVFNKQAMLFADDRTLQQVFNKRSDVRRRMTARCNKYLTRRSKPPLTRVGLAWISPAAAKSLGSSPTSHFLPYLSNLQFHSFLKHLCTAETQNAETGSLAKPITPV